jgi:hypothetical protein
MWRQETTGGCKSANVLLVMSTEGKEVSVDLAKESEFDIDYKLGDCSFNIHVYDGNARGAMIRGPRSYTNGARTEN